MVCRLLTVTPVCCRSSGSNGLQINTTILVEFVDELCGSRATPAECGR
jgi:hypothetical protein